MPGTVLPLDFATAACHKGGVDVWHALLDIVLLLGGGALLGGLFERARQSAIVGYLLAGVLLGPNGLSVVHGGEAVRAVSELGIALLLFAIGLEFSWSRLRGMGSVALGSGTAQVAGTLLAGAVLSAALGLGAAAALAVGALLALSSTAGVMRLLAARGEVESLHGERALGILLVQDVAVVPLVLVVSVLSEGGSAGAVALGVLRTGGIGLLLVAALYLVFRHVVPRLLAAGPVHGNRELALLLAVVSGLGAAVASHVAGVSPALGSFVAGLLLAGSPFAVQVRAEVSSLKTLLLALFFTSIGMLSDPAWIAAHAPLVASVTAGVVLLKTALVAGALSLFRVRPRTAVTTGIALAQIGEFSFVLAGIARGRLLDEHAFALVVSTAVLTMVLTPYLVAHAPRLAALVTRGGTVSPGAEEPAAEGERLALVVGFGPAGRAAAERLAELGCRVVVLDQNPAAARAARELGYAAVTGDARYVEVLEHAGLLRATLVVVTVPGTDAARHIVGSARLYAPQARVLVRARFHRALADLTAAGAHVVVDEEHEVGRRIALAWEEELRASGEEPPPA